MVNDLRADGSNLDHKGRPFMYGLYILLALLLFIAFLPFIRFFIMRWAMLNRLRSLGKKEGFSVFLRSPLALFSMVGGKGNDLYIKTVSRTYSVKLLGFPMKKMMLCFFDGGTAYAVKEYKRPTELSLLFDGSEKKKKLDAPDFKAFLPEDCEKMRPLYLVYPQILAICHMEDGNIREIKDGDRLFGKPLTTLDSLLSHLSKAEEE